LQCFGGGLAVGEVCGALSGAAAALGLLSDPVPPGDFGAKMAFSERTKALAGYRLDCTSRIVENNFFKYLFPEQ
ncbi:MAG: C-GCAxxG-C-C family protein, partial [Firmicutes bacterium]|nr:C-GCAxxG-C-C family protein [Bacillota bacterium]